MASQGKVVAKALDELAKAIRSATSSEQKLSEILGWNGPPLNRNDIALVVSTLASRIRAIPDDEISDDWDASSDVQKIEFVRSNVVGNLFNGNGLSAFAAFQSLIFYLETTFDELFTAKTDWEKLDADGLIPTQLAKRVRSLKSRIDTVYAGTEKLTDRVEAINKAYDAAIALPTDIDALAEDRNRIAAIKTDVDASSSAITRAQSEALEAAIAAKESAAEAAKLVENTADAYRAATTKGLSESFQTRADITSNSMWIWVFGLIVALCLGAYLGGHRLGLVQQLLSTNASSGMITINLILAAFSIAAPVWFAWIATKQIGHRFRLSEDYAFKASVAKAYEGYRREAARIDESFAARLFSSALDRLDEAPLRFVETETFGSPWHEVMELRARREAKKAQVAADRAAAAATAAETVTED